MLKAHLFYNHDICESATFYGLRNYIFPEACQAYEEGRVILTLLPYFQLPLFLSFYNYIPKKFFYKIPCTGIEILRC